MTKQQFLLKAIGNLHPNRRFGLYGENYSDVEWQDNLEPEKATQSEVDAEIIRIQAAYPLQELRRERNQLLESSDWTGLADSALTSEVSAKWKLYRQKLRDLPGGLDTEFKVKNAKWPDSP